MKSEEFINLLIMISYNSEIKKNNVLFQKFELELENENTEKRIFTYSFISNTSINITFFSNEKIILNKILYYTLEEIYSIFLKNKYSIKDFIYAI